MRTEEQILEEIHRLLDEERFDEADRLVDQLQPVSADELARRLSEAPYDDEPFTEEDRAVFDRAWRIIRGSGAAQTRRLA